jgi:hypothetical protein
VSGTGLVRNHVVDGRSLPSCCDGANATTRPRPRAGPVPAEILEVTDGKVVDVLRGSGYERSSVSKAIRLQVVSPGDAAALRVLSEAAFESETARSSMTRPEVTAVRRGDREP